MIYIASRATCGIKIPNKKQARDEIISLFKAQMNRLKQRLNVCIVFVWNCVSLLTWSLKSQYVAEEVSLTCDAWQALNTDGYFAVTGHWIEECSRKWTLEHALFGFTWMNIAHNGDQLGQALFKICDCLSIVHKVNQHVSAFSNLGLMTSLKIGHIAF